LWDVETGTERTVLKAHTDAVGFVRFSPDGKTLASGARDEAKLWDVATGTERTALKGYTFKLSFVEFSPDGKTLLAGAKLWDVATGTERAALWGDKMLHRVAFSPDSKMLASTNEDRTIIKLWDVATGTERAVLKAPTDGVIVVAVSPDGKTLASGGKDGEVMLWTVAPGK
jgi:WD40 repeat protein